MEAQGKRNWWRVGVAVLAGFVLLVTGCTEKRWDEAAIQREIACNLRAEDAPAMAAPAPKFGDQWHPPQAALKSNAPAPTVRKGPKVKSGGRLVSSWIVEDAGDATYDGTYIESGTYDSKPLYSNGTRFLFWSVSNWALSATDDGAPPISYTGGADLPGNPWSVLGGTTPAPTVSEYVAPVIDPTYDFDGDAPHFPDRPLAPGKATLSGVPFVVLPNDKVEDVPYAYGFRLFNLDTGVWSWANYGVSLFGGGDEFNTSGLFDLGDDTHVWVSCGVWDDEGVPKVTFKKVAIVPGVSVTGIANDTITLTAFDCSNFVQVSAGVFRFMLIDGTNHRLCEYMAGSGTYSVVATYASGTDFPAGYSALELTTGRTDHALFSHSGTLYWMRRCANGDATPLRRVSAFEVNDTTCTLLADVIADTSTTGDGNETQTWATFGTTVWGDLGHDSDHDTRFTWVPGDDATEATPVAIAGVNRRWYLDDDAVLMVGWYVDGGITDKAFVYRSPRIHLVVDGEGGGSGDALLHITRPVLLEAEGTGGGSGDAVLIGATHIVPEEGEGGGSGEVTLISATYPEGPGAYSELMLTPGVWPGAARRIAVPSYFDRGANRKYGGAIGNMRPTWRTPIDEGNPLAQYVAFWSWIAEDTADEGRLVDATRNNDGELFITGDHPISDWSWVASGFTAGPPAGNWFQFPVHDSPSIVVSPGLSDFTFLWDFTSDAMTSVETHTLFMPQESFETLYFAYGPLYGADSPVLGLRFPRGAGQVHFSDAAAIDFDGVKRVILSCDRDGLASVYVNGALIGDPVDISEAAGSNLSFYYLGGFSPSVTTILHEYGYLIGYAATAKDVATNPALALRYGLRGSPMLIMDRLPV